MSGILTVKTELDPFMVVEKIHDSILENLGVLDIVYE